MKEEESHVGIGTTSYMYLGGFESTVTRWDKQLNNLGFNTS